MIEDNLIQVSLVDSLSIVLCYLGMRSSYTTLLQVCRHI